ncbi:MAG: hypothetical protein NTW86_27655 [Candidatus Sumerlaeota bacterium]|nr:hypothetical protein [Candidatus Sumerlaeota bacterium]
MSVHRVEHLLIGGYAVIRHGYVRATAGMDIWVRISRDNAERLTDALKEFGFDVPGLSPEMFLKPNAIIRLGVPPIRIEILNAISGVAFEECYARRQRELLDGDLEVDIISLDDLKTNKKASGRLKDLADLDYLP